MYEDFYNIEAGQINMTRIYEMHDLFQPLLELPNVYSQNGNYPAPKFLHIPKNLSHNHCQHRKWVLTTFILLRGPLESRKMTLTKLKYDDFGEIWSKQF